MLHHEYLDHLAKHFRLRADDIAFSAKLGLFEKEIYIMKNVNLDPVIPILDSLYSPAKRKKAKDPTCMLRSLILMTVLRQRGITGWVAWTRFDPLIAILTGFEPDATPGIGTYYDFMKRIVDGPYRKPCQCEKRVRRSKYNAGLHIRNLEKEKKTKKNDFDPNHSQSEKLARTLLENEEEPRPKDMYRILEDLQHSTGR